MNFSNTIASPMGILTEIKDKEDFIMGDFYLKVTHVSHFLRVLMINDKRNQILVIQLT